MNAIANRIVRDVRALPKQRVNEIRGVRRAYSKQLKDSEAGEILAIAYALRDAPMRHLRWVGYELILHHKAARKSVRIAEVETLAEGLDTWDGVDTFGLYISGPAWRDGQIKDSDIKRWAKSDDLWIRRAALVSTVVLNSKSRGAGATGGDAKRTLPICKMLIDDREDMVVKALSWALRVLAAVDPAPVRAFLKEHDARLAARVKRETNNKLKTGLKNPKS